MKSKEKPRVIVALTETAPIDSLWHVVNRWLAHPESELVTIFIEDDRWSRAASLPFTREIPRYGGSAANFSMQRAEQIRAAAIEQARERMKELAANARRHLDFTILSEPDEKRIREIVGERASVIVAPALISKLPVYLHFSQFNCRIELVDSDGAAGSATS